MELIVKIFFLQGRDCFLRRGAGGKAYLKISFKWCFYCRSAGDVILLGKTNMLRFNHPQEAAKLRKKRYVSSIRDLRVQHSNDISRDNLVHKLVTSVTIQKQPAIHLLKKSNENLVREKVQCCPAFFFLMVSVWIVQSKVKYVSCVLFSVLLSLQYESMENLADIGSEPEREPSYMFYNAG